MSKLALAALLFSLVAFGVAQLNPYLHHRASRSPRRLLLGLTAAAVVVLLLWGLAARLPVPLPSSSVGQSSVPSSGDESSQVHSDAPATPAPVTSAAGCDPSLWNHVYHPSRLTVLDNCKTVTGTIDVVRVEADGDDHILLQLDAPYASLINSKNVQAERGDLVLEPVCEHGVTQRDAEAACQNYTSPVVVPPAGTHVTVTGSYVLDTDHGWNEIHPVTSIAPAGAP